MSKRKKKKPQRDSGIVLAAVGLALQVLAILVDILLWIVRRQ